jgi:hypothetical protein
MREWSLKAGDPLSLTLACDVRLGASDYCDDQIWELSLHGGDPPALALQTTFGLRARAMRLFPRFTLGETALSDPEMFAGSPTIQQIYPNFALLTYAPFPDIDVSAEYWVPQSHAVAGRLQITNNGKMDCSLLFEWVGQLTPTAGQRMAPVEMQAVTALSGQSDGLSPVIFMTGGPKVGTGTYPSLAFKMELAPNTSRQVTWVQASLDNAEASFALARNIASQKWEAERSRLEILNAGHVDIYTGDADWDTALMLAQKQAIGLLIGPTTNLPHASFALSRQPDQGYSLRGDGSEYNHLWNGQAPLEAYYLAGLILPVAPDLTAGLLRNFLAIQGEDGFIDWKPGLGSQRSKLLAAPLLASLAWQIYEATEKVSLLEESFDRLVQFVQAWFTPAHDRDGDSIPEWDHPMQAGSEDHPVYAQWHAWAQGVDITTAESTALNALLFKECTSLVRMARVLGRSEAIAGLETIAQRLKQTVESSWDETAASYFDRDRDTHYSTHGELLAEGHGSGTRMLKRNFEQPVRLLVNIRTDETVRRRPLIFVHGKSASGYPRIERIGDEQFRWTPGWGRLTGQHVYSGLERIEVSGLDPEDHISIASVSYDFMDHSTLTPLWAGLPSAERAGRLVDDTLTNPQRFWRTFGVPACVRVPESDDAQICGCANLVWNTLIGEGLLHYGYRAQAADLVTRLMNAVIQSARREGAFRRYYHAETGQGMGERNALNGLAPLGLFLQTLGVRLISPNRVALSGVNPFPWPVTVKYRGITVLRQKDKTIVIFADGQTVTVTDPAPRIVSLE